MCVCVCVYMDRVTRAFIRVQPTHGWDFAAVLMNELLLRRTGRYK